MCTKQAKYRGIPGILLPRQLWNSYRLATEQLEILNIIKTAKILAGFPQLPLNADNLFCVAPEQLQIGHGTVRDFEHYIDPCIPICITVFKILIDE